MSRRSPHPSWGRTVDALVDRAASTASQIELASPDVGAFRSSLRPGDLVVPGQALGELEALGSRLTVIAPDPATGRVVEAR
ncbi:MAG: hypothetical protein AAGA56_08735, partial [Myxococcota bacterium]